MNNKFVTYTTQGNWWLEPADSEDSDVLEVYDLQDILDNFGTGQGDVDVEFPDFYQFLMTAKVGESKCGMYGSGSQQYWTRIY